MEKREIALTLLIRGYYYFVFRTRSHKEIEDYLAKKSVRYKDISDKERQKIVENIFFFFQAEDGIRDTSVTGVQTCALPISRPCSGSSRRGFPTSTTPRCSYPGWSAPTSSWAGGARGSWPATTTSSG